MPQLPAKVQHHCYGNNDVRNDNVSCRSWVQECRVALEKDEDDVEDENDPSTVGCQPSLEGKLIERFALMNPCLAETDVAQADDGEDDESANTGDVDDVGEDGRGTRVDR